MEVPTTMNQQGNGMSSLPYKLIASLTISIRRITIKTFYKQISGSINVTKVNFKRIDNHIIKRSFPVTTIVFKQVRIR